MAAVDIPQTLEYRCGQLNAAPVLEVENLTNYKKRFVCHIIGIEPQFENIIKNGPFVPMTAGQRKPENQWTGDVRKDNLDQRLKSLIMSVLPDDQMNSVINCLTVKSRWDDLILYHEGPLDVKESRVMDMKMCYNTFKFKEGESLTQTFTKYKALMIELVHVGIKLSKLEINTGFINGLPKKWLSFYQSLRNTNNVKDSELASLFGKLKYEENLIESIYETEKNKSLVSATPLSTAFISSSIVQDFQDSPDDEEDIKSSHEFSSAKATDQTECHKCGKKGHFATDCWSKTSVSTYQSTFQPKPLSSLQHKPELRPTKDFEAKYNKVKAKLALLSLSSSVSKASMHVNTKIIKENKNLRTELKELKAITKIWLTSSDKVNLCIGEQIPSQKKRILGVDQLTKDPSSSGLEDLVFVKSSDDDTKVTTPGVERPWLSEAEGFILPNHDTSRILPSESQRNIIDSSTIKSILRSKSTFKAEALKDVTINELSSTPAQGNKSSSASKVHSAPAERKINPRNPQHAFKKCEACGSPNHTTTDHYDIEWFKRGEALQDKKAEALKSTRAESSNANRSKTSTKRWKRGTIFNSNKEIVMIAPRLRDVYVLDMTSSAQESCFFTKASENLNWLWHKILTHLNFKTINKLVKQNIFIGLLSLVYSKDKPCSSCEKGNHHRANFKTKQTSSIKKCLHLLHMDLFGPITLRSINHEKYTILMSTQESLTLEENKLKKPITSHLMKALRLLNSQNPQLTTSTLLNQKDIHLMNIFILMNLLKGAGMLTRAMAKQLSAALTHKCLFVDFLSEEETKNVSEALKHPGWVDAIQDELNQFSRNKVYTLVPAPYGKTTIGSRWANPKESYLIAIKRIFRYLKGTPSLGLWYLNCSGFDLKGYSDSDYAGCNIDKKSTSGQKHGARSGLRRKQYLKHTSESTTEASKSQTSHSKKAKSSSAMNTSPSHPLPPTPMVGKMHKETQQAAGGLTSLGDTNKDGVHSQLSSGSNPSVLVDKTKFAGDGLKIAHTTSCANEESKADDNSRNVKLEDLADILKDIRFAFFTPDSPTDEPIIVSDVSEEEEKDENDKKTKDTLVPPPSPKLAHLQELIAQVHLLQSQKKELEQAKVIAKAEVASMKAKPSYLDINQLTELLEKLNTLDYLLGLLKTITNTLNRFTTLVENASGATTMDVPSADKAIALLAERETDADTNLKMN
nr:hypothetical protein [Tanacetum cinerariifolium]